MYCNHTIQSSLPIREFTSFRLVLWKKAGRSFRCVQEQEVEETTVVARSVLYVFQIRDVAVGSSVEYPVDDGSRCGVSTGVLPASDCTLSVISNGGVSPD